MLFNYDYTQTLLLILTYMVVYNITSFLMFATIIQLVNTNIKTLFSFSNLDTGNVFTKILSLVILSLAGVPPLVGFFSKIFVFVLISNSNLFILFPPFFILLFTGLYFYIQNLRFLNSTNKPTTVFISELTTRVMPLYFAMALPIVFFILFGFCYLDDLFLVLSWVLL